MTKVGVSQPIWRAKVMFINWLISVQFCCNFNSVVWSGRAPHGYKYIVPGSSCDKWQQTQLVPMRMHVQSLTSLFGLRIRCCCEQGHRRGSNFVWLWHRPAAVAPVWPLAWELPYAASASLKSKKKKKGKKKYDCIISSLSRKDCLKILEQHVSLFTLMCALTFWKIILSCKVDI